MISKLRAFAGLSWSDKGLFLEAWLLLLALNVGLRLLPFRWVRGWADRAARVAEPRRDGGRQVERCRRLVATAAANHLPSTACLARSIALRAVLARRGVETSMRVGVQREDGELAAHAWVEWDGRAIGEPEDVERRYLPLLSREAPR